MLEVLSVIIVIIGIVVGVTIASISMGVMFGFKLVRRWRIRRRYFR